VNTETTEHVGRRGWIFYDAECPTCRAGMRLFGRIFDRRGFEWLPLQTPGLAIRLGLPETALFEEMKLQLANGRVIGGLNSWIALFRSVWWLWPVGTLLSLPGIHALSRACYRWIARNRYCFGGKCRVRRKLRRRRKIPFLDLP
jgi:predicted DCC family thiol-disulfide oxidoreductase YuxK